MDAMVKEQFSELPWLWSEVVGKVDVYENACACSRAASEVMRNTAVLVAIGRSPNGKLISAEKAGVNVDERGFIKVDKQLKGRLKYSFF